jgi:hypothetical protein
LENENENETKNETKMGINLKHTNNAFSICLAEDHKIEQGQGQRNIIESPKLHSRLKISLQDCVVVGQRSPGCTVSLVQLEVLGNNSFRNLIIISRLTVLLPDDQIFEYSPAPESCAVASMLPSSSSSTCVHP